MMMSAECDVIVLRTSLALHAIIILGVVLVLIWQHRRLTSVREKIVKKYDGTAMTGGASAGSMPSSYRNGIGFFAEGGAPPKKV